MNGIPWKEMLGGATGWAALFLVLSFALLYALINKTVDTIGRRLEGAVKRLEVIQQAAIQMAGQVDLDLRKSRIDVYKILWEKTGTLPKWPRNAELTYDNVRRLTKELRDWYFEMGGLYLSRSARVAYGALQEQIVKLDAASTGRMSDQATNRSARNVVLSGQSSPRTFSLVARPPLFPPDSRGVPTYSAARFTRRCPHDQARASPAAASAHDVEWTGSQRMHGIHEDDLFPRGAAKPTAIPAGALRQGGGVSRARRAGQCEEALASLVEILAHAERNLSGAG
jgi:hypothetical protein